MKVGVVTIAAHRTAHLRMQMTALARGSRRPDQHVVVSMGDHEVFSLARVAGADAQWMEPTEGRLPLAEARNLGARRALELGAELLVFLDVDCIPATNLVSRYEEVGNDQRHQVALLCGPVTYLPPPPVGGYDLDALDALISPHPARPHPRAGEVVTGENYTLLWPLSFAVTGASAFAGWAEPMRFISITRYRILRLNDWTISLPTSTSFMIDGVVADARMARRVRRTRVGPL